jgi:hypothetical protein
MDRYCAAMAQEEGDWSHRVARLVGARVRHYRLKPKPKMSAQALADRCVGLGFPLDRSVIAKLEAGNRQTITVPEVLVLARALRVPPLLLVTPVGHSEKVEILPDTEVDPWAAAKWLTGEINDPFRFGSRDDQVTDADPLWPDDRMRTTVDGVLSWFRRHDDYVQRWRDATRLVALRRREAQDAVDPELRAAREGEADARQETADRLRVDIVDVRAAMRTDGLTPPELPAALRGLDEGLGDGAA